VCQKIFITFCINCLIKEQRSNDPFSGYRAPHINLHQMQRTFNHCMWVFSTPKSTVLTVYVAAVLPSLAHLPLRSSGFIN
jgi:hypothetical protein